MVTLRHNDLAKQTQNFLGVTCHPQSARTTKNWFDPSSTQPKTASILHQHNQKLVRSFINTTKNWFDGSILHQHDTHKWLQSADSGHIGLETDSGHIGLETESGHIGLETDGGHIGLETDSGYIGLEAGSGHFGLETADTLVSKQTADTLVSKKKDSGHVPARCGG